MRLHVVMADWSCLGLQKMNMKNLMRQSLKDGSLNYLTSGSSFCMPGYEWLENQANSQVVGTHAWLVSGSIQHYAMLDVAYDGQFSYSRGPSH